MIDRPDIRAGRMIFAQAVSPGRSLKDWKTKPNFLFRILEGMISKKYLIFLSSRNTDPDDGLVRPDITFNRVVLPEPDFPVRDIISPFLNPD